MNDSAPAAAPEVGHTLPYCETTDETYSELVAGSFAVEEPEPGTLILRGPCPRCGTLIDIAVVSGIFRHVAGDMLGTPRAAWGWRRQPAALPDPYVEPMICTCEDPHPDRPEGRVGCGAYWTLTISPYPGAD